MQLQPIQPTDYGLQPQEAENVLTAFAPKAIEFKALINDYLPLLTMELSEAVEPAKELKKKLIEFEKGVNKLHKTHKEFSLNYGRFVDSNKNIYSVTEHKKKLDEIIKHEELQKKAELKAIADARHLELNKYMSDSSHIDASSMSEEVYQAFLSVKVKEWQDAEELKKANEIIAKIYQSETFEDFNAELFGSHIEERKKQINASRLLAIANYNGGELDFELDSEELKKAYNDRLIVLDGIRVERIKNEMQRLYQQCYNNILDYVLPNFDAQEFTEEWHGLLENLRVLKENRIEEINSILSKLNNVRVVGNNVLLSNDVVFCTVKELTLKSIEDFNYQQNALLGGQEAYENWINSFAAPTEINDPRTREVLKKFEAFKKWALTLK